MKFNFAKRPVFIAVFLAVVTVLTAAILLEKSPERGAPQDRELPRSGRPQVIVGKDGVQMVYVPAGVFFMGDDKGKPQEGPRMRVFLESFYIDRVEISNERYAKFIEETGYRPEGGFDARPGDEQLPATRLTWKDAKAYCKWAGKRLPTEYEWEKAARGLDDRRWPWGNEERQPLNDSSPDAPKLWPVQEDAGGQSPYGCLHMADNVWEWTDDWFIAYALNPQPDPRYGRIYRVLRGGLESADKKNKYAPVTRRYYLKPHSATSLTGGRCAMTLPPE